MPTMPKTSSFREPNKELDDVMSKVVARVLGISQTTMNKHKHVFAQLPGARGRYNLPLTVQAYLKFKLGTDGGAQGETTSKRGRHIDQQTRKLELENREKDGELIRHSDASAVFSATASALRAGLTALPGRLASVVAGESRPSECRALINAEIHQLLIDIEKAFSEAFPEPEADSGSENGAPDPKADPDPDARPMGGRKSSAAGRKRGARKVAK